MTRPRRRTWIRALPAAGLLLLLAACAVAPELLWQRADEALIDRVDDWVELDAQQEQALRARLVPWLERVRAERLGRYAAFLRGFAERIEPGITRTDLEWAADRAEVLYEGTVASFLPVIAPTLAGLTPEQRRHLAERIAERNEDYRDDYVDGRDGGRYAIAERVIEAVERWTGELGPRQREQVHARIRELPRTTPGWYRWRSRMQQRLLERIERGADAGEIERLLRQWWIGRGRDAPGVRGGELRAGLLDALTEVLRSLDSGQRAEARQRLRSRADSLQTLADGAGR